MADLEVLGALELLGWEEHRGILQRWNDDHTRIEELVPADNGCMTLLVRRPGGRPFCVTVDAATFHREIYPDLEEHAASSMGKTVEELRAETPYALAFSTIPAPCGVDCFIPEVLPTSESPDGTTQGKEQSDVSSQDSE